MPEIRASEEPAAAGPAEAGPSSRSPCSPSCCVCGSAAPMVCANCGGAAYCGKDHQRQHWLKHKTQCFPCTVRSSDWLGRFLETTRSVQPGTLLVREWPLVVGPRADSQPVCLGCHCVLAKGGAKCSGCRGPVCDNECEKLAAHGQWECKALGPDQGAALNHRPELVLPLRCLLGVRSGHADWKAFLDLESHLEKRRGTRVWEERQQQVVEALRSIGILGTDGSDDELMQTICGILDVNSFEVRGPSVGQHPGEPLRAVFLRAAMMAHSCQPNCQLAVDDHLQLTVRASCSLPRGAPVQYNYCELLETTARRQEHLREGKYFECTCPRCSDPTECGTHLSSLWCPHCLAGTITPPPRQGAVASPSDSAGVRERPVRPLPPGAAHLPVSCAPRRTPASRPIEDLGDDHGEGLGEDAWRCTRCRRGVAARCAQSTLQRCTEAWEVARRGGEDGDDAVDTRCLEALLARLSRSLPPQHALQLAAKQVLVAMYRDSVLCARRPAHHALARMQTLCQEIIDTLELLLPGHVSRLKGIALHELHMAVALEGSDLPRARALLQACVRHLQLEPPDSPEGRLHQLALQELAAVEEGIRQDLVAQCDASQPSQQRRQRRQRNKK